MRMDILRAVLVIAGLGGLSCNSDSKLLDRSSVVPSAMTKNQIQIGSILGIDPFATIDTYSACEAEPRFEFLVTSPDGTRLLTRKCRIRLKDMKFDGFFLADPRTTTVNGRLVKLSLEIPFHDNIDKAFVEMEQTFVQAFGPRANPPGEGALIMAPLLCRGPGLESCEQSLVIFAEPARTLGFALREFRVMNVEVLSRAGDELRRRTG